MQTLATQNDRYTFWLDPAHSDYPECATDHCRPEFYLDLTNVTCLIVDTIRRYATTEMSILELGSGTGRNLAGLVEAGFANVAGVEINRQAIDLGMLHFPVLAKVPIVVAPVESCIRGLPNFDVIFTQGFLMHLPPELEWVIETLPEKARRLIVTNEGERRSSFHAWSHDYQGIIEGTHAWEQVEMHSDERFPPLPATTVKRVFTRKD